MLASQNMISNYLVAYMSHITKKSLLFLKQDLNQNSLLFKCCYKSIIKDVLLWFPSAVPAKVQNYFITTYYALV